MLDRMEYIHYSFVSKVNRARAIRYWQKSMLLSKICKTNIREAKHHFERSQLKVSLSRLHSHADWSHAIRRAGRWFVNMEKMNMFRRWKLYLQYRLKKKNACDEAHEFWRVKSSRQVLEQLKQEVEIRRIILTAQRWWTGNLIGRCFGTWCSYLEECRIEKEAFDAAIAVYETNLVKKSWNLWNEHHEHHLEDGKNIDVAIEHWIIKMNERIFEMIRMNWKDAVAQRHHESRSLHYAYLAWLEYVSMRTRKHDLTAQAIDHWTQSSLRTSFTYLSKFAEYQNIIRRGLMFFTHSLHYRIIQYWRDFVDEQKCQRKAVEWFLHLICRRIMFRWSIFVDLQCEKRETKAFGDSFFREKMLRLYLLDWRECYVERRGRRAELGNAVSSFAREIKIKRKLRVFDGWADYSEERVLKKKLKAKADAYYKSSVLSESLHLMNTWAKQRKENEAILRRFATWFTDLTRRRVFAGWVMYLDSRRFKKRTQMQGTNYFLRKVLARWAVAIDQKKESMAIIRRAAVWLVNALSKRIFLAWVAFIGLCRDLRAEIEGYVRIMYLKRLRRRAIARNKERKTLHSYGTWHLSSVKKRALKQWHRSHTQRKERIVVQCDAYHRAQECWSNRKFVFVIEKLVGVVTEARMKYNARDHFRAGLLERTFHYWLDFSANSKRLSEMFVSAESWCDEKLRMRMWLRWCTYVSLRISKAEKEYNAAIFCNKKNLSWALRLLRLHSAARHKLYASEDIWIRKCMSEAMATWDKWLRVKKGHFAVRETLSLKLAVLTWERYQVSRWASKRQFEMAERHVSLTRKRVFFSKWRACGAGGVGCKLNEGPENP